MTERGYILFDCRWTKAPPPRGDLVRPLIKWRQRLVRLGLIGVLPDGIGFGNLSARLPGRDDFVITGTQTGGVRDASSRHFTRVTDFNIDENRVDCSGPVQASSEALTHAACYVSWPGINAVLHVHSKRLWETLRGTAPTTVAGAEAGTPEIARAVLDVVANPWTRVCKLMVLGGHQDGILVIGKNLDEAGGAIDDLFWWANGRNNGPLPPSLTQS